MPEVVQLGNDDYSSVMPMDWESSLMTPPTKYSSKIDKVVSNLRDLENTSSTGGLDPIKR